MVAILRREPSRFWRRAQREERRLQHATRQPIPPDLPLGTLVRVPDRGDMFVRYLPGPPGAPTVLLLHGWMASADVNWLGAYPALEGRYHVLAMDMRGHGRGLRSAERFTLEDCADDAAALLHTLGIRDAIVAGYSMGGPVALLLARRYPRRVRGLVLIATAADLGRTGGERGMSTFVRLLGPVLRSGVVDVALRQLARREPPESGGVREFAPWLAGEMKRLHPLDVVDAGKAIAAFDAREWLDELRVPAVSVVTTRDWAVRPDKQRATADALGASVIELDAGHLVCTNDPEAFGVALRDALDLVAVGRRDRWLARVTDWWLRLEGVGPTEELSTAPVTIPLEVPVATRALVATTRSLSDG